MVTALALIGAFFLVSILGGVLLVGLCLLYDASQEMKR
jgi:hypothetical protein